MERDFGTEIDILKQELDEIKGLINAFAKTPKIDTKKPLKHIHPMANMHPDKRLSEKMAEMCLLTDENSTTGLVTYMGVYASGGRQTNWIRNEVSTDALLKLVENNTTSRVLNCIGNNDRLNILLTVLKAPRTVAQLVEQCGYNSTGQVYHHLKPLLATGLVKEDPENRGFYVVPTDRVQGIIMLLAGISDLIDPEYTNAVDL